MVSVERRVRIWAGSILLISLALGTWVHPAWYGLSAFVGAMLIQSGFTGFCPAEKVFRWLEQQPRRARAQ